MFNSIGGYTSRFADEIIAETTNLSTESQPLLKMNNISESGLHTEVTMVRQKLRYFKWDVSSTFTFQNNCASRCPQKGLRDSARVQIMQKCIGVDVNQVSSTETFEDVSTLISIYSDRQYDSFFLSKKDGRGSQQRNDSHSQGHMEFFHIIKEDNYSRIFFIYLFIYFFFFGGGRGGGSECKTRFGILKFSKTPENGYLSQKYFPARARDYRNGSLCIDSFSSNLSIHDMRDISSESSNRCFLIKLRKKGTILCIFIFFIDRESSFKG